MRILITLDQHYPIGGGIQQFIRGLGIGLKKLGHETIILTRAIDGEEEVEKMPEGKLIRTEIMQGALPNPEKTMERWKEFIPLLKEINPDVIHANNHSSAAIILAAKELGIKVLYTCHGWGMLCPLKVRLIRPEDEELCMNKRSFMRCAECGKRNRWRPTANFKDFLKSFSKNSGYNHDYRELVNRYSYYNQVLNSADRVISLSKMYSGFFDKKRTKVIPLGIDTEKFKPTDGSSFRGKYNIDGPYIIVTSRIHHIKGQHWAVEALKYLDPDIKLVLAGNSRLFEGDKFEDNIHTAEVRGTIERTGTKDRIIFTGFILPEELAMGYSEAVATIVPSVWADPHPTVVIEALSCGCPVVVTSNSGSSEAIDDGQNGYIIPRKDPIAIADAINKIIGNRDKMGGNARNKILEEYAWDKIVRRIENEILELVNH